MKKKINTETAEEQKVNTESPETVEEQEVKTDAQEETVEEQQANKSEAKEDEVPVRVDAILKLYPQYDECYVDKSGFVYPKDAPKYQRKDAVLYKNKYYNS